jgi:ribonuclease T2
MTRIFRTVVFGFIVLCSMFGLAAAQDRRQNEPGKFDFYMLSLSWSPSFCETARDSARQQQCGRRPYSFVVHGLWPQYDSGFPEFCQVPAPRLNRNIVSSMLDLMPARGLIFHEWDSHGTCSGLEARDYFTAVRKARAAVNIPTEYLNPEMPLTVSPGEVIDAFIKANEGLTRSAIVIDCNRTRLREVRICLSRELHFRDCADNGRRACRSATLVMPPVRGAAPAQAPAPAVAAPAKPAAPFPAATAPKQAPAPSAATIGANQYATEAQAKARCGSNTVVYVNLSSKIYHFAGHKDYGTLKNGAYMCEKDTAAARARAAKDEKRP